MVLDSPSMVSHSVECIGLGAQAMGERLGMIKPFGDHQAHFGERQGWGGTTPQLPEHEIFHPHNSFYGFKFRVGCQELLAHLCGSERDALGHNLLIRQDRLL